MTTPMDDEEFQPTPEAWWRRLTQPAPMTDEEFDQALEGVTVKIWFCPVKHPWPAGRIVGTVEWDGPVARCLYSGCGRDSTDPVPRGSCECEVYDCAGECCGAGQCSCSLWWECRMEHEWPEETPPEVRVRVRGAIVFCLWTGCGRISRGKSNHQCRSCSFWFEGPWSRAHRAGDVAEVERIQMEMNRGFCDPCVEKLVAGCDG